MMSTFYERTGSIFVSGQPTSNHGNRPRYPYRLRLLINFDLSSSICGIRARKQSNTNVHLSCSVNTPTSDQKSSSDTLELDQDVRALYSGGTLT